MSFDPVQEFIELAVGDGQRRVRTPEGARFYGQPIGTIITAEMIRAKKLEAKAKGIKPPKGGLSKKPKQVTINTGKASPASNFDSRPAGKVRSTTPEKLGTKFDPNTGNMKQGSNFAPASGKFQVKVPTIKGPNHFKLGDSDFSAPAGSKLIKPKNKPNMAFVVTPDGSVHSFNESGEIDVPDYLEPVLKDKFKELKSSDPLFKVENFDSAKTTGLAEQTPGAKLKKNNETVFEKQATGTWLNSDLGIELSDDDLQANFDNGDFDLDPGNMVEDTDFSKLTEDELVSALDAMPTGKQLKFGSITLTKNQNGSWKSNQTGKSKSSEFFAGMAAGTGLLSDKLDTPDAVDPDVNKREKSEKDAKASDPLENPDNEINDANAMTAAAKASPVYGSDIHSARVGDVVYHDTAGALTKKDNKTWETVEGKQYSANNVAGSANSGFVSKKPWDADQVSAKEKFDAENTLTVNGKKVNTIAKFGENDRSEKIKADGGSTPNVFELEPTPENAKTFRDAMKKSLEDNPYSASVYIYDEEDYAGMRLFLADDGKSGIALHDGDEIVSAFSDPKSKNKKVARHLISIAVENGGTRLDAFDTVLPGIYAKEGFNVKARLKWNDEYAPDGWDKETFKKFNNGEPDVVFMQYDKGMEDLDYEPGSGEYVEDYDAGLASTGGKAQDDNDYRPETGDPDNEDSTVETSPGGWVVPDSVHDAIAEGKKITAIKALYDANPDKKSLGEAKAEIEKMISDGIAPGTPLNYGSILYDLPQGAKIKVGASTFTKNENNNWVSPNGGVYTSQQMFESQINPHDTVLENPNYKEKKSLDDVFEEMDELDELYPEEWKNIPENGEKVTSLEGFVAGDKLLIQTPEGTHEFTKNPNGSWHDELFDVDFLESGMMLDVNAGTAWKEVGVESSPKKTADAGEDIGNVLQLQASLAGTYIKVDDQLFQKKSDGYWYGDTPGYEHIGFTSASFKDDISEGKVKKLTQPSFADISRAQAPEKKSLDDQLANGEITFGKYKELKGEAISDPEEDNESLAKEAEKNYTQDAIDALEAHSGFQIAYGLKSLPDEHPFKSDKEFLDQVVADAKSKYPDLPPKKALIKFLKSKNGQVEPLADWELELLESNDPDAEKFQIGTRSPKDTATGVTGGAFKKKDIQSAIDILENYNGKLFKNELNKQGNPLGKLSPNHIVGFDKDKTITKQKFIDALKKKIAKNESKDSSELPDGELAEDGQGILNADDLDFMNTEDVVYTQNKMWIKDDVSWSSEYGNEGYASTYLAKFKPTLKPIQKSNDEKSYLNSGDKFDFEISDTPETGKVVAADQGMNALLNAPEGAHILRNSNFGEPVLYRKDADGLWYPVNEELMNWKHSDSLMFYNSAMMGKLKWVDAPSVESDEKPKVGDKVSYDQVLGLPVGTVLSTPSGTVWEKVNNGDSPWQPTSVAGDKGPFYSNDAIEPFSNAGNATIQKLGGGDTETSSSLKPGDKISDMEQWKNLPIGSKAQYVYSEGDFGDTYIKRGPSKWTSEEYPEMKSLPDVNFIPAVLSSKMTYLGGPSTDPEGEPINEADSALDAAVDAHFQQMAELDKAVSIVPEEERGANGDGFVIVHTDNGPKITWGKYGGGGIATTAVDENGVKKVLIGKRGDRDEWYLPGGAIDEKETHLQGSLREFSEEVEDGDAILDNIKIVNAYQAVIGKIEGTDKDWKYVTSVAELPSTFDVKAPESSEPWELAEYQWFSAEELDALDKSGKLHPALGNGNLAQMVGFQTENDDLHAEILSLMNQPDDLNEDRYDISDWKKIGGSQGGSNSGWVYEDKLGNKYYVKESNGGDDAMHNEVIGSALYRALGVNSNEAFFVTNGSKRLIATPWVENNGSKMQSIVSGQVDPDFIKAAQKDFAIDAWLDNYDVVGIGPWNLVQDMNGDPFRIDPGGSMMFRATGNPKSWWSDDPTAIDDMRFGSGNSSAYTHLPKVFGSMTDDDVKESAKKLLDIDEKKIKQIVNSSGLDDDTKDKLAQTLITRRQKILERFGLIEEPPVTDTYVSKWGNDISPEVANLILQGKSEEAISLYRKQHAMSKENAKADLFDFGMEAINGKDAIAQYKKGAPKPAFAKGATVKVKGEDTVFYVELSNNEATAGVVNGKFLVYLNDELTSDTTGATETNYGFTSNGEVFKKGEQVLVPEPGNSSNKVPAYVVNSDWSSGLVNTVYQDKVLQVDKSHISKYNEANGAPERIVLPDNYAKPPQGSTPVAKYDSAYNTDTIRYIIKHPDGTNWVYGEDGTKWMGSDSDAAYSNAIDNMPDEWFAWDGKVPAAPANDPWAPSGEVSDQSIVLPDEYAPLPAGASPISKHKYNNTIVAEYADGSIHFHHESGNESTALGAKETYLGGVFEPYSGESKAPEKLTGPVDMAGSSVEPGMNVLIMKYNKGGFSKNAKIVSINTEKNTAKVQRLDDHGVPITDENGKPVYATMSLNSLRKSSAEPSSDGTPTGITFTEGDKSSSLYGTAEPKPPVAPAGVGSPNAKAIVPPEWFDRAEKAYAAYRAKKNLSAKSLKDSSTAWAPMEKAMKGDETSLELLKSKGYLDDEPKLYEELQQAIDAQKAKYADVIAKHEQDVLEYQKLKSEWMSANGVASYTPLRHEDVEQWGTDESHNWMVKRFNGIKLTTKAKNGLEAQKQSSNWQTIIRKLPAILGLRREDVASAPGVTSSNMEVWDGIKEAADIAGPIGVGFRAVRTISFDRLVGPDGTPLNESSDLSQIIGSIQKDHGGAELNPNSLYNKGKVNDFYPVIMDLAVPPEAKGWYTGVGGFSHGGEYGIIMEPGMAMYITDAKKEYVEQLHTTRWVVKASIIPREVMPYMNNFEGDPMSHNILIPGKDTTTGIPSVQANVPSPSPQSNTTSSKATKLNESDLKAMTVGTEIDEISVYDSTVVDEWTKVDVDRWKNSNGQLLESKSLAGFEFEVVNEPSGASLTGDGKWTKDALDGAELGKAVADSYGVEWVKVEKWEWENSAGQIVSTNALAIDFMNIQTPEDGKWDYNSLGNAPYGTKVVDTHGDSWTKMDDGQWYNELDEVLPSSQLAQDAMSLGSTPQTMPQAVYTSIDLNNMAVGSIVIDGDGDSWEKLPDGNWIALNGMAEGEIRESWALAGYFGGLDNGI